jgi:hypothetical protein
MKRILIILFFIGSSAQSMSLDEERGSDQKMQTFSSNRSLSSSQSSLASSVSLRELSEAGSGKKKKKRRRGGKRQRVKSGVQESVTALGRMTLRTEETLDRLQRMEERERRRMGCLDSCCRYSCWAVGGCALSATIMVTAIVIALIMNPAFKIPVTVNLDFSNMFANMSMEGGEGMVWNIPVAVDTSFPGVYVSNTSMPVRVNLNGEGGGGGLPFP